MNKILTFSVILMLAVTSFSLLATNENSNSLPADSGSGKAAIGGAFTLTDMAGEKRSDTEFRGRTMLVFFGFTHCPDICPLTMATLTKTWELLESDANKIVPIFISVDPKRDTPDRLREYLSNFDARIIGLTGSADEIREVASLYKAFYSEVVDTKAAKSEHADHSAHAAHGAGDNYMVDHSSFLYVMNQQGEYVAHFPHTIAPEELAIKLKAIIQ